MVDTFAAIPFVWYVLHRETQREWRARHRSLAQELIAVADRLEQDPDARHLELVDVLLRYAHLLWHRPELVSSVPVAADRKESLERFAFRFVLNYLREAMPRGGRSRRPMKEVALIVSALLDRPIKANAFQNDAVLEQIWPRKRYMTEGRITGK